MPRIDPRLQTPAKNVNEAIQDATVRHMLYLEGLKTRQAREILDFIDNEVIPDLKEQLQIRLDRYMKGAKTTERLEAMIKQFEKITADFKNINTRIQGDLFEIALYEAEFNLNMLKQETPVNLNYVLPAPELIKAAIRDKPFDGRTLGQWFDSLGDSVQTRLASEIRRGVVEGQTTAQIVQRIGDSKLLDVTRAQTNAVVRTAIQHATSSARDELFKANSDIINNVKWVSTLDSRTSPQCKANDGKVFPVDSGPRPPIHVNCLAPDTRITSSCFISKIYKRAFEGKMFTIKTRFGNKVSVTPNHPILTNRGWIGAQFVNIGDKCFVGRGIEGETPINGQNNTVHATIEEIFESFRAFSQVFTTEVPLSAPDFHNDAIDNEVASVNAKLDLGLIFYATNFKHGGKRGFVLGDRKVSSFYSRCNNFFPFNIGNFPSPICDISFANELLSLGGCSPVHSSLLLRTPSTQCDTFFREYTSDWTSADTERLCDSHNANTLGIFADDIIDIEVSNFSGHVYNVETGTGFINSNNIITHNCRSAVVPITKSLRELGVDIDDAPAGTRASMNGQVPSDITYNEWLKTQPISVQNDALGITKARLFREGGLSVDRFVNRNGFELTLDELKKREAQAFVKAGLA